jgi:hypothetical protein
MRQQACWVVEEMVLYRARHVQWWSWSGQACSIQQHTPHMSMVSVGKDILQPF